MAKKQITQADVEKIASLANLKVTSREKKLFSEQFTKSLDVIDQLQEIDTKGIKTTHQVTGLKNVTREDKIDETRMLSQKEALSQAKKTHKGFFVVPAVIHKS